MTRQIIFKHFYDLRRPVAAAATAVAAASATTVSEAALLAGGKTIDKPNQRANIVYK